LSLLLVAAAASAAPPALSPEELDSLSSRPEEQVPEAAAPPAGSASAAADEDEASDGSDFDGGAQRPPAVARDYSILRSSAQALQHKLVVPELPDLAPYTDTALKARIRRKPGGRASIGSLLGEDVFRGFAGADGRLREWAQRQASLPQAIYIEGGYVTPRDLARQLPKTYFAETAPGVFIARLPIDVRPGATLHIGSETKQLRLSQDRGAFLVSEGQLFITDTHVLGWNESRGAPSAWRDGGEFRPFLLGWGGSDTYISGSKLSNLGYAASKSYGVSISQFSPALAPKMKRRRPGAWLLNSEFYDNWYGFYCYEADDLVIVGNRYHDNIVYGIDPHDRSHRLIIARNKAHGTKKKHGIIVSREVNDSWIFDNHAYDNALSGIVIDRSSVNNVVANNQVYRNQADGITIYESPDTLLWRNVAGANRRHGIRVRNSTDVRLRDNVAFGNGLSGVYGHVKDLRGTDRNLALDPFSQTVSMIVAGGQLVSNGSSPISIDQPLSLELHDVQLLAPRREFGIKFTGILGRHQDQVLDLLVRQRQPVVIRPVSPAQRSAH